MDSNAEHALDGIRQKVKERLKREDSKVSVSMHIPEPEPLRTEGEEWQDSNGRWWRMKNGKKDSFSPLQAAKTPWWCPRCEKVMNHRNDDTMYRKKGMCFDCVLKIETKIRYDGKWEQYERHVMRENELSYLRDTIEELEGYIKTISQPSFVLSTGEIQRWHISVDQVKADIQKNIDNIKARQTQLLQEKENAGSEEFERYYSTK